MGTCEFRIFDSLDPNVEGENFPKTYSCSFKCSKCVPEDHEGFFCRCESRNMEVAKQLRDIGLSPWMIKKNQARDVHEKTLYEFVTFLKPYHFNWDSQEHIDYLIGKFLDSTGKDCLPVENESN